ncbi:MAG: hypothetical protein HN411_04510 [Waddliaceae bacterium]|nr:hypothetical protein [Waddliaceae bacterium]MBT3579317.1 hypothetical protein [Waddliaceae bacterium]MBT4445448.1 hypothetical protein [Waddliaceae bacterium]MBT6928573.1 hypothetical protein [Waddliaceae bacterium]MBT7461653.1 hypothetical protein [Waddliaceae bacterium]
MDREISSRRNRLWKVFLEEVLFRSWWVFIFCIVCFSIYEDGMSRQGREYRILEERLHSLEITKVEELARQEDLLMQIDSQDDPRWVEFTLMKVLGLVPEDYTKVYFKPTD